LATLYITLCHGENDETRSEDNKTLTHWDDIITTLPSYCQSKVHHI